MGKLHVITGTPAPDTPAERQRKRLVKAGTESGCLSCPRCGSLALTEVRTGMRPGSTGKPVGGTKQWICAMCQMKGEWVVVS